MDTLTEWLAWLVEAVVSLGMIAALLGSLVLYVLRGGRLGQ
jgi:hypothetical protein